MGEGFIAYIERIELIGFFSGYPVVLVLLNMLLKRRFSRQVLSMRIRSALPAVYPLLATLYTAMLIKSLYPSYTVQNLLNTFSITPLRIWAITALIFWLPYLKKRISILVVHSAVFLGLLGYDVWTNIRNHATLEMLQNDIRIFGISILLSTVMLLLVTVFIFILQRLFSLRGNNR